MSAPGDRVGPWRLETPIGRGGFSEVWRARRAEGEGECALKLLVRGEHVAQLREEATALSLVSGRGVVRVLEVRLDHDPPYLALELASGGDLRARIAKEGDARRRLQPPRAVSLVQQLLAILARVHAEGIVHGDLKPENVLFHGEELRLADFGLSRRIAQRTATLSVSLGATDARIAGTLDYMAPEQRDGQRPTKRTDVYAVGVILHELLTGERPQGLFALPSASNPLVPPVVDDAVACALSVEPGQRFADAGALLAFLREGLASDWADLVHAHDRLACAPAPGVRHVSVLLAVVLIAAFFVQSAVARGALTNQQLAALGALGLDGLLLGALLPWVSRREVVLYDLRRRLEKLIETRHEWPSRSPGRRPVLDYPVLKTKTEVAACRALGEQLAAILTVLESEIRPGVTTGALDARFRELARERGLQPSFLGHNRFKHAICTAVNDEVVNGIPGARVLAAGDLLKLQAAVTDGRWHATQSWTYLVGGDCDPADRRSSRWADRRSTRRSSRLAPATR